MLKQFIKDLKEGDLVNSPFMVKSKKLLDFKAPDKQGQKFISLVVSDKTGDIMAKVWENVSVLSDAFAEKDIIFIRGQVTTYKDKLEITVNSLRKCPDMEIDLSDFLPHSEKDLKELLGKVKEIIQTVRNSHLKNLLSLFFEDAEFVKGFTRAPGSKSLHHAYIGGLLEHTCNVIAICEKVTELYPQIDRDLLLTGAVLHDIGKMKEYEYERVIDYTTEGSLIGHVVIGEKMLREKLDQMSDFPEELKLKLTHILLSHHGEREWGAPIVPQLLEAIALHYAENLDAKIGICTQIVQKEKEKGAQWTEYIRSLRRYLYLGTAAAAEMPESLELAPPEPEKTSGEPELELPEIEGEPGSFS